jgi:hypothetical protein
VEAGKWLAQFTHLAALMAVMLLCYAKKLDYIKTAGAP